MSEFTERFIADIRNGDAPISVQERALLELADQRDELLAALEAALPALYIIDEVYGVGSIGIGDNYQVNIRDALIEVRRAIAKAKEAEHGDD